MHGDTCPICKTREMPRVRPGENPTARRCQNCGYVQELGTAAALQQRMLEAA